MLNYGLYHIDCGLTDYDSVWKLQRHINSYKQKNKCSDIIISTEHNHVYTLGKAGDKNHLLADTGELKENNISYYEVDRGGDLTYHGPGQLVLYPILDLNNYYLDLHKYLRDLEEVIILTLRDYGIESGREEGLTGVWVDNEKICSIGIKISRWITMHGLALNVNNELNFFDKIIPCGIFHKGVTSMKKTLDEEVEKRQLKKLILKKFEKVFNTKIQNIGPEGLLEHYQINRNLKSI